jgi:hypothetical protein
MKHINILFLVLGALMLVLVGCTDNNITGPVKNDAAISPNVETEVAMRFLKHQNPAVYPLMADKEVQVGNVYIMNDDKNIYVSYEIVKGWMLKDTNLHLAKSVNDIPMTKDGKPYIDMFVYKSNHKGEVSRFEYMIPLSKDDNKMSREFIIAAHAVIVYAENQLGREMILTAWGGEKKGPGPEPWYVINYKMMTTNPGGGFKQDNITAVENIKDPIMQ